MDFCTPLTTPRARKVHRCTWCGEPIAIGEKHKAWAGTFDGDFSQSRLHDECYAAMRTLPAGEDYEPGEFKRGTTETT